MGNGWEWLGNGWGVSNLCAPLRGIPGRGLFFPQKSAPFPKKCICWCFYDKTFLFIIKRPDPGPHKLERVRTPSIHSSLIVLQSFQSFESYESYESARASNSSKSCYIEAFSTSGLPFVD